MRLNISAWAAALGLFINPALATNDGTHRTRVDIGIYPWSAVGKIYNGAGGACTGSLVGPNKVLTAAHCIFNARTRRFVRPERIHFLLGYESGRYRFDFIAAHYEIGSGYDPSTLNKAQASDWAVLTIVTSGRDAVQPLQLASAPAVMSTPVMLPGFAIDHAFAMTADIDCHVVETNKSGSLLASDCVALKGDSGAPLISSNGAGGFFVVGVQTAVTRIGERFKSIAVTSSPGLRDAVERK